MNMNTIEEFKEIDKMALLSKEANQASIYIYIIVSNILIYW
jgi:hypothetical protein